MHSRNHQLKYLRSIGALKLSEKLVEAYGSKVLHGPFKGMVYPKRALLDRFGTNRLLGSYEQELHSIFNTLDPGYELMVDVGAAEGYYAVGMALLTKSKKIYAYETDPRELSLVREMASLNNVAERIEYRSWCDPDELCGLCANRRCFVLSDCEGYEKHLFTEAAINALSRSDVLIELHEDPSTNLREELSSRFRLTHDLNVTSVEPRHLEHYPEARILGDEALAAIQDHRLPSQQWLFCKAKRT